MTLRPSRFQYQPGSPESTNGILPYLSFNLRNQTRSIAIVGLVDSGSSVNVLPYAKGVELGAVWEQQTIELQLGGNLAAVEARGLLLTASIARFNPVRLAFAWARSDNVPLVLGQMNFFQEFDLCFFRTEMAFEIHPRRSNQN